MTFLDDHRISGGIGADDEFWKALEVGALRLPRCASCERWIWPAHFRCGQCGSWELRWDEVAPEGVVYSWTRTWYSFDRTKERAEDVPYVVALVEIPHAGNVRVLGMLDGDESTLAIGASVTGTIHPPAEKSKGYPSITWSLSAGAAG